MDLEPGRRTTQEWIYLVSFCAHQVVIEILGNTRDLIVCLAYSPFMPRFPAITQMRATLCTRMHLGSVEIPVRCLVGRECWRPKLCGCPHTMSLGSPMQWRGGPQTCDDNCPAVWLCRRTRVPSAAAAGDNLPVADADFNWGRRR